MGETGEIGGIGRYPELDKAERLVAQCGSECARGVEEGVGAGPELAVGAAGAADSAAPRLNCLLDWRTALDLPAQRAGPRAQAHAGAGGGALQRTPFARARRRRRRMPDVRQLCGRDLPVEALDRVLRTQSHELDGELSRVSGPPSEHSIPTLGSALWC